MTISGGTAAPQTLHDLLKERGWAETGVLGIGAGGPVLLIQQQAGNGKSPNCPKGRHPRRCALKRSTSQEIAALQALASCSHIMALEETFCSPGTNEVWARLEWLDGGNLRGFLRHQRPGKISEDVSRFLLADILKGIKAIHELGWTHRDIKAENIAFTLPTLSIAQCLECCVKLIDFDTAVTLPGKGNRLTEVLGTVENMAPEVFAGSYDERADCWSLGVVAYEIFFGYRPFNDASIDHVQEMVQNWQRYLVIPSDASDGATSFLHGLLANHEERSSSAQAARHPWLQGARESISIELAAAAVAEALEAQDYKATIGSPIPLQPSHASSSMILGGASSCVFSSSYAASSSSRSCAGPSSLVSQSNPHAIRHSPSLQSPIRQASFDSLACPSLPDSPACSDAVGSLSRIRRSLSSWNAPSIGCVFSKGACASSESSVSPSFAQKVPAPYAELLASATLYEPSLALPNLRSREAVFASSGSNESAAGGSQRSGSCVEDDEAYLQRVRSQVAGILEASDRLEAAKRLGTPSTLLPSALAPNANIVHQTVPRALQLNGAVSQDTREVLGDGRELAQLKDSQARMKALLSGFASAADEAKASCRQSHQAAAAQAAPASSVPVAVSVGGMTLTPLKQTDGLDDRSPVYSNAAERAPSPSSWLLNQRRRTQELLSQLQCAAEQGAIASDPGLAASMMALPCLSHQSEHFR